MIREEGIFKVSKFLDSTVKVCMCISTLVSILKFANEFLMVTGTPQVFLDYIGVASFSIAFGILGNSLIKQGKSWGWLLVVSIAGSLLGKILTVNSPMGRVLIAIGYIAEIVVIFLLLFNFEKNIKYYAIAYLASAFIGVFMGMGVYIFQNASQENIVIISKSISLTLMIASLICYYYFAKSFTSAKR